jgi:gamma-glutamyl AIG2-like cyclotransferase
MSERPAHTELLFSYGTLQLEAVQIATFGRTLAGTSDALPGFELVSLEIEDQKVIAISGKSHHTMASFTGRASDVISGMVFTVTPGELQNADQYEVPAVKRVAAVLQSGVRAWVYVDASSAR